MSLVAFGLGMFYAFTLSRAVQWILLPALLVLPYVVTAVCQTVSAARVERARRDLEVAMDVRLS